MSIESGKIDIEFDVQPGCHRCDSLLDAHRAAFDDANQEVARVVSNRQPQADEVSEEVDVKVTVYCSGAERRFGTLGKKACYPVFIPQINVRQSLV